ncbi:hypothetical protein KP509_21G027000 [Ceratopteris richardii]|nr:hypothetical protein KP509_21G027000 [Ceratopteris richardii]
MWVLQEDDASSEQLPDFSEALSPTADSNSSVIPFAPSASRHDELQNTVERRQFWKSGDFSNSAQHGASFGTQGMDHVRVHPKFLHSNATSHKWVLGAIAELLDNAVDEIRNGATFVKVDVQRNPRNGEPMLVIEDDGGGMDPDCMRHCMSLGYSAKSKLSNTIGQYGNGFKTSTMRLGADVVVFSRCGGEKPTQSIGMISYTFLTTTGQNDVVIPIVDFHIEAVGIRKLIRSNTEDWVQSLETIEHWSPYPSQKELLNQFESMSGHGTRVVIYNLWQDEEGHLELDFDAHPRDIQIKSTTRDEKNLKLAARHPSCKNYLTYKHSLRTYVSFLYLHLPAQFHIYLRGEEVHLYSLQNDMMLVEQVIYRPKDSKYSKAVVTLGFVKDAKEHVDVSGFNVYHKNRLIKPFWRLWNTSGTQGRGIIAILEANFVEPAHDKQGFERTVVLTRLEARLIEMQKKYWFKHCHEIGYTNSSLKESAESRQANKKLIENCVDNKSAGAVCRDNVSTKVSIATSTTENAEFRLSVGAGVNAHDSHPINHISRMGVVPPKWLQTIDMQQPINPDFGWIDRTANSVGYRRDAADIQTAITSCSPNMMPASHLQMASFNPSEVKMQDLCSSSSAMMVPVTIDLDLADANITQVARPETSSRESSVSQKTMTKDVQCGSDIPTGTGNTHANSYLDVVTPGSRKRQCVEQRADNHMSYLPPRSEERSAEFVGFKDNFGCLQYGMLISEHSNPQNFVSKESHSEIFDNLSLRVGTLARTETLQSLRDISVHSTGAVIESMPPDSAENAIDDGVSLSLAKPRKAQDGNRVVTSTAMNGGTHRHSLNRSLYKWLAVESMLSDTNAVTLDADAHSHGKPLRPLEEAAHDRSPHEVVRSVPSDHTEQEDINGSVQMSSCRDIISLPTNASVDAANMCAILVDEYNKMTEQDRLLVARHQIEYLQQSIHTVGVEITDLKEKLRKHRELEQLELRKLDMELNAALSRLEELRG